MSGLFYAVVEGDPLTSGLKSRVYASSSSCHVEDDKGLSRRMVFIGDKAYCEKCDSMGEIVYGASVSDMYRMIDMENAGRRQAVGGDWVICKCSTRPSIIAVYGRRWIIRDEGTRTPTRASQEVKLRTVYDEQFALRDGSGQPLANVRYRVRRGATMIADGITDATGRTQRINTEGAMGLTLEIANPEGRA